MKFSTTVCILASLVTLAAGGEKIEGWIIPLSELPINVVPWHPLGEFLVIHEREFLDHSNAGFADVEPVHSWITVVDD